MVLRHHRVHTLAREAARTCVFVLLITVGMLFAVPGLAIAADTTPPSVPANVNATPGSASPTIATVTWDASTDDVGVAGYYVWRALSTTDTPVRIGETDASPFDDESGVPGQAYYYSVSAFDAARNVSARSTAVGPVQASWIQAPHATYSASGRFCRMCHTPHEATTQVSLMRQTSRTPGELSVCYACHDGQGASTNILSGPVNSFALTSGHTVEAVETGADLTNLCSSCHNVHNDYTEATGEPSLPRGIINGTTVDGNDNTWCLACHNDSNDWYGAGYPALSSPSRNSDGYPVYGTFPGRTVYEDPTKNAHASIPASGTVRQAGDCLYCHASHRAANEYDGLVATFTPSGATSVADDQANGTYATSCFDCHGGVLRSEFTTLPVDIKQFATAGGERSGHRIKTSGGNLSVGAPLPCYDCHNPHGSSRGNGELLADTLGQNLNTDTAVDVRHTCFSCHSSDDGMVWDSTLATPAYVAVGAQEVEGLRRDGGDGSVLSIPFGVTGHSSGDSQSCYQCHGQDYDVGGYNVHNPTGGVSPGGVNCYLCHLSYESPMEDGGASSTTVYHHVMGTGSSDGGTAFAGGAYPTSTSDVYCMSCHADHDQFNDAQAGNLRLSLTSAATTSAADYVESGTYGICVSCHASSLVKDTTNQVDNGSTRTPKIVGGASGFTASEHHYPATSTFGDSTSFSADCSKCHTDEQTKDFQTSTFQFGTHYSAVSRLLSALGGTLADPLGETHCYRCHSQTTDSIGGTVKSVSNRDWYNATPMTSASERVYAQFQLSGSKHPVVASGGNSVECESCHNVHVVLKPIADSGPGAVTDADNTYNALAYGTTTQQATFCLRCHDGSTPTRVINNVTYIPYSVTIAAADATIMNKNTYAARGHWTVSGSITSAQSCAQCHESHGSSYVKLLGAYDMTTSSNRIVNHLGVATAITGNDNTVCYACHTNADAAWPSFTRASGTSGYPIDGTWPGTTLYDNATTGIHRTGRTNVVWPGTSYAAGDCKNCHDVHGTANTYDELRGTFSSSYFGTCFTCHDSDGPSSINIAQYYWSSVGGSVAGSTATYSHSGNAGVATPCYDCHNPHGSASVYGLQVKTMTNSSTTVVFGDTTGEIIMSTSTGVRHFCLSCHVSSDSTGRGWDGTTYSVVGSGAIMDGYDRDASLKINHPNPAHRYTSGSSCLGCHSNAHRP